MANNTKNLIVESGLPLIFRLKDDDIQQLPEAGRPETVRAMVNSLTVFQKEAIVTSRRSSQSWRMASDEGKYLNGHDSAPAPLAYLTVGMVSSFMNEIQALARLRDIKLDSIKLIQDNYYSMKGSMMKGTMTAYAHDIGLEAVIESDADKQTLQALVIDAVAASPLNGLMKNENEALFKLFHNNKQVDLQNIPAFDRACEGQATGTTNADDVGEGNFDDMLIRGGLTPKNENTADKVAGTSLTDHQDRLLHLRGICTVLENGVKHIEQQLFNPHGSTFYFLSDEGPEDGGSGQAPNAASYISAGIGFCFMTQFGRFAKMQNSKLKAYSIVQDAHFSIGGASAGTGKPGEMDPLETFVFLESEEDDDFARNILEVAERTCFLHAFSRTKIKAKVKVTLA